MAIDIVDNSIEAVDNRLVGVSGAGTLFVVAGSRFAEAAAGAAAAAGTLFVAAAGPAAAAAGTLFVGALELAAGTQFVGPAAGNRVGSLAEPAAMAALAVLKTNPPYL